MNSGVYVLPVDQTAVWIDLKLMPWAEASRPLLVGMYHNQCVCVFGTIPTSLLSEEAYLWLWTAPELPKTIFGRCARKALPKLLALYPKLICNCFNPNSARWLRSLGARQAEGSLFIFERKP